MRAVRTLLAAGSAAALLGAGCTGVAAPAYEPGAPGIGDPYFPSLGNSGYEVSHYDLAVRYQPAGQELVGQVTLTATATEPLASFTLDLSGLTVTAATVEGAAAEVTREDDKLRLTPAAGLSAGAEFTATVDYGGVPAPIEQPQLGSNGFHPTAEGAFVIGQPISASTWFPVNEHPLDKATYAIEVTVPEGLAAISNGVPDGRRTEAGWSTWRWVESTPMASYLTTLAIGDYRLTEREHAGRPLVVAVHADLPATVDEQLLASGEIADQLAEWFGPYPVDAYGGIALADPQAGFALETQSRPIYGPSFFVGGLDGTWVIVHELAHQWFGNSVSVRSWQDIWLNEGFATYAEWLWFDHAGEDTAQETFDLYWDGPGAEEAFWTTPPGNPGAAQMFGRAVYLRGALTVHALRLTIGDDTFFDLLRTWTAEKRNGNANTAEFVALAERVSGQRLQEFFDDWLFQPVRPPRP